MRITARITQLELAEFFRGLFPLRVQFLDDPGHRKLIDFAEPRDIHMVPGEGVEITCDATIHWPVIVDATFEARHVSILMRAAAVQTDTGAGIRFSGRLSDIDLKMLPAFADAALVKSVNAAIKRSDAGFTWQIAETLSVGIDMPMEMVPIKAFTTDVDKAAVAIDAEGLTLTAPLHMAFERASTAPMVLS